MKNMNQNLRDISDNNIKSTKKDDNYIKLSSLLWYIGFFLFCSVMSGIYIYFTEVIL